MKYKKNKLSLRSKRKAFHHGWDTQQRYIQKVKKIKQFTLKPRGKKTKTRIKLPLLLFAAILLALFLAASLLSPKREPSKQPLPPLAILMPFDNADKISITDYFGPRVHPVTGEDGFHHGMDFGTPWHCPIKAVAQGEVYAAESRGELGNCVILTHDIGDVRLYSLYAHLSEIKVQKGDKVIQGQVIGLEGGEPDKDPNPGGSTGHHLHFSILDENWEYCDPKDYLPLQEK